MGAFRILLAAIFLVIVGYTGVVIANHGLGLFAVFFGDMAEMGWPGQFNLDFMGFLLMSGVWLAWRNDFTPAGLVLGLFGFFLGAPYLTAYLFVMSHKVDDDFAILFLGERRAREWAARAAAS